MPDFLFQDSRGQVTGIAEEKTIGCVPSHYPRKTRGPNQHVRPVDVRASKVQGEYETKLRDHDPTGRAVARLHDHGKVGGLVVGAFGEFSEDLHSLLNKLVEARIPGTPELTRGARSHAYPWVRRQVAVAALRARANLRINGLAWCGPGGAAAYARRHDTATGDSIARAQMEAADYATMFRKHGRDWVFHVEWGRC